VQSEKSQIRKEKPEMKECRKKNERLGGKTNSHKITSSTEKTATVVVFVVGAVVVVVVVVVVVLVLRSYNGRRATSDTRKAARAAGSPSRDNSFADDFVVVATSGACIVCCRRWKSSRRKEEIEWEGAKVEEERVEMAARATRKVCRRFLLSDAKRSLGRRYNWRSRASDNSNDNEDKEAAPRKKTMGKGRPRENPGGCRASNHRSPLSASSLR